MKNWRRQVNPWRETQVYPRHREKDPRILVTTGHNEKVGRSTEAEWVDDVTGFSKWSQLNTRTS